MAKVNVANTKVVYSSTRLFPYYNDFDEEKSYYQIVFNPEFPVQSRELTQMQTILQNQIERFGKHIFVDGSPVIGGGISVSTVPSLNVQTTYANTDIVANNYVRKTVQYAANTDVQARVIDAKDSTTVEPPTLFLRYLTGDSFGSSDEIKTSDSEYYANVVATSNSSANALMAFIPDSIYFVDGYFVKVPTQSVIVDKYSANTTNARVGLEKVKSIVTADDDNSLLDPAAEASNFDAPGAHRFKFELILNKRSLDSEDDEQFIELMRIEEGQVKSIIDKPVYSEIEETLARRTYDESGNYTVKPFKASMRNSIANTTTNVAVTLSPGKAYVFGYETEIPYETVLEVPRAQTTRPVTNYDLNLNYGNYVYANNVQGLFDVSTAQLFDLHCVRSSDVDHTSSTTYNRTKIGTARVRDIEAFSVATQVAEDREFEFYLFGSVFSPIAGTASSTANSTSEIVLNTSGISANNNAYVGATIRLTGGTGEGDVRTITAFDGATKRANVGTPFSATTDNTTEYSIDFDFGEVESFVINPSYTVGGSLSANADITISSKSNGQTNGDTQITEPARSTMVFKFPENYIAPASLGDISYNYRKKYNSVQFTDGASVSIIAGADEGFEGTSSSSNTDSRATENFLITVADNQGGSRANGEQIPVTTTVTIGDPEQASFDTGAGAGDTFLASVLAKMDIDGSSAGERVKTLVKANTATFATESPANTFISSTGSNTSVYLTTGQVFIENPSKVPDEAESLYISDVIAIKKIYDLNGASLPAAGASLTGFTDVTNKYRFNNGQRDGFYDHASIRLKPGVGRPNGPLVVCTRFYKTTSDFGYFSVDSYPNLTSQVTEENVEIGTGYSLIPEYNGIELRDAIDFRPVRRNGANTVPNFSLEGVRFPVSATDLTSDYEYYLGRRDLIVMTPNRALDRVEGTPDRYPQYPTRPSRSMVLHTLHVPPFTEYPANVEITYINNQRYTMKDIGNIDKRLQQVEYYLTLSQIEQNTLDRTIEDVDGLDRSKYGVFVDAFTGHALADWEDDDYAIAMDISGKRYGGLAAPTTNVTSIGVSVDESTMGGVVQKGDRIILDYTTEVMLSQNVATKFTPVADYLFASYEGQIIAEPEADIWKDQNVEEVINTTERTVEVTRFSTEVDSQTRTSSGNFLSNLFGNLFGNNS